MTIDSTWLLLSLVPSGVGLVLFVWGRKHRRWPQLAGGVALMIYPYFAPSMTTLVGIGLLLGVAVWYAARLDL